MGIIQRQNYFKGQEMQNVPPWREKMQNRTDLSERLLDFAASSIKNCCKIRNHCERRWKMTLQFLPR